MITEAFESGMYKNSERLQNTINKWEAERRSLIIEEQEVLKVTKTFFDCSNLLLEFCKDCHSAYLGVMTKQKKQILKIVCSNVSYDGENLVIEPNIAFKAVIKNSLNMKKLPRRIGLLLHTTQSLASFINVN